MYSSTKTVITTYLTTQGYTSAPASVKDTGELAVSLYNKAFLIRPGTGTVEMPLPNRVSRGLSVIICRTENALRVEGKSDYEAACVDEADTLSRNLAREINNRQKAANSTVLYSGISSTVAPEADKDTTYWLMTISLPITFKVV